MSQRIITITFQDDPSLDSILDTIDHELETGQYPSHTVKVSYVDSHERTTSWVDRTTDEETT